MTTHQRNAATLAALALSLATTTQSAHAQDHQNPQQSPQSDTRTGTPPRAPVALTEPYRIEPLGLSLLLPDSVSARTSSIPGGRTTTTITPSAPDTNPDTDTSGQEQALQAADWFISIYNLASADRSLTHNEALDAFLEARETALERRNANLKTLTRLGTPDRPLRIGPDEIPAARAYTTVSPAATPILTGYTVISTSPGNFIVFQLTTATTRDDTQTNSPTTVRTFDNRHIRLYESIVASASAEDPELSRLDTRNRFQAGAALLASFTAEDLRRVIEANPDPTYIRLYRPAPTNSPADATEVAFQRIEYRIGQLGELERDTPKSRWSRAQRQFGFIVEVKARTNTQTLTADTNAIYFLSNNLDDEYWSTTTVTSPRSASNSDRSNPDNRAIARESLVRRGSAVTVAIEETGRPPWTRDWNIPARDGTAFYIPRVTLYLLPLLVADRFDETPTTLDLAFYAYDSSLRRLTTRKDSFDNLDRDGWLHTSSRAPEQPDITTTLNADGHLVSRELPGGTVAERTTQDRLASIWLDKGLNPQR